MANTCVLTVSVPASLLSLVMDMASSHIEDIKSGLADGTYEEEENLDFTEKCAAVEELGRLLRDATLESNTDEADDSASSPQPVVTALVVASDLQEGDWIEYQDTRMRERVVAVETTRDGEIKVHHDYGNGGEPATSFYEPDERITISRVQTLKQGEQETADIGKDLSVIVTVTAKIQLQPGESVEHVLQNTDYEFKPATEDIVFSDTELIGWDVFVETDLMAIVHIKVRLTIKDGAQLDIEEILSEMDYSFPEAAFERTEICGYEIVS